MRRPTKNGGFIPGHPSGSPTRDYLARVCRAHQPRRGPLGGIAVLPTLISNLASGSVLSNLGLGGTAADRGLGGRGDDEAAGGAADDAQLLEGFIALWSWSAHGARARARRRRSWPRGWASPMSPPAGSRAAVRSGSSDLGRWPRARCAPTRWPSRSSWSAPRERRGGWGHPGRAVRARARRGARRGPRPHGHGGEALYSSGCARRSRGGDSRGVARAAPTTSMTTSSTARPSWGMATSTARGALPAADDRPGDGPGRPTQLPPMYEVIDYYTERGVLTAVGEGPVAEAPASPAAGCGPADPLRYRGRAPRDLKSQRQIDRWPSPGGSWPTSWDRLGDMLRPGVTTLEPGRCRPGPGPRWRALVHRRARAAHTSAMSCVASTSRLSTASPASGAAAAGQIVSIDAIVDGGDGGTRPHVGHRRGAAGPAPAPGGVIRQALLAGIAAAQPGNHMGDISAAVEDVALQHGYGIVRTHVGHGIDEMHEVPQVENYRTGRPGAAPGTVPGRSSRRSPGSGRHADARRRIVADGSLAAHWEHSIAITEAMEVMHPDHQPSSREVLARDAITSYAVRGARACPGMDATATPGRQPAGPPPPSSTRSRSPPPPVAKKDAIEVEGTVVEPLPNAMFAIELEKPTASWRMGSAASSA